MTIPQHVAIIMDGNRRWAKERNLPIFAGHKKGAESIEPLVQKSIELGIQVLSFWAFSTENWKREKSEVDDLLLVFREAVNNPMVDRLQKNGVKVSVIGDFAKFPDDLRKNVGEIIEKSKNNTTITVNFALNYGGRDEIIRAYNKAVKQYPTGITKEQFATFLDTSGQPDPDLLIRTGGEKRTSGFMPFQTDYAELVFVDTYWPDFTPIEYTRALEEFGHRKRRFGK